MKKIIIIGSGWYGCSAYMELKDRHNVIIIEQCKNIFEGSSYYNQNRLHLGYHYCRDYATRTLCKENYDIFLARYKDLVCDIEDNYYAIADKSILDFQTYVKGLIMISLKIIY
jgi:L-2-hydroxyglutarate oxidase LhgO